MMLQFINMEVKKLIICSESWKHQILFNSFIFGIALRNKHIKVNIFSESSLCGLIRVLQTTTNIFCPPSQHISFLPLKGWGFLFYFFLNPCLFSYNFYLHRHIWVCVHIHTYAFLSSIMKEKNQSNKTLATELSNAVMLQMALLSLPVLQLKKLLPAAALKPPTGLRRQFQFTFGKLQMTATEISILP